MNCINEINKSNEISNSDETNNIEKIICNKSDILLSKNKDNSYNLSFDVKNNMEILLKYKSYELLEIYLNFLNNSNDGIIEKVIILNKNMNSIIYCIIFKQFGADFGIKQKYLCVSTDCKISKDVIKIYSNSVKYNLNEYVELKNCEEIYSKYGDLSISKNNDNLSISYKFDIDFNEDLPIFMENLVGLFMKRLFINFKNFLEKFI